MKMIIGRGMSTFPIHQFDCEASLQTAIKVDELPTFDSSCKVYATMLGCFIPGIYCVLQIFKADDFYSAWL